MVVEVPLTIACGDYDRTRAIKDGRVSVEGCAATYIALEPEEVFFRAFRYQEFDVCELSLSSYLRVTDQGSSDYIGIPAFVSRVFRHSGIYVRTDRGIRTPQDLKGKVIGLPEYQITAVVWMRGILQDDYGVTPTDIHWRSGGIEQPGRDERTPLAPIPGLDLKPIPSDKTLSGMLEAGEIDAMFSARAPSCFTRHASHIGRLFPDYRAVERDYYQRTGIFPPMHLVGVRKSLVERHPWLPTSLYKAFCEAKALALAEVRDINALRVTLPWLEAECLETIALMGEDYWRYGVEENRKDIETLARYSHEQGLVRRRLAVEELFAKPTLEILKDLSPAPEFSGRAARSREEVLSEVPSAASRVTEQEALDYHRRGQPGKIEIMPTKPLTTQQDLSLAYSPGVAYPCLHIERDPACAYDYTAKGNMVAVITNGTAVLGLGDLGALAAKPVMEGKAVLFKRFAGIDSVDLEIATRDVDEFVNCVRFLHPAFGGINLEDIKAPECFIIEQRLRELMDIPVFHDDQHGTAIITAAALLNALDLTGRDLAKAKVVVNGAGAAAIACIELVKTMGLPHGNIIMCDTKGVVYEGRRDGMNQWKSAHAVATTRRSLAEALDGADVFIGLSVKGAVSQDMVRAMADKPIIAAMANPDPEITPEDVRAVRDDAIICTGRSDYPNQINNVLGFPYIFRGALDVRASTINDAMKIAAAHALARLAREDVPDEVAAAYAGQRLRYGPDYIVPTPFDPRLIWSVPPAVAKAAMDSGVARRPFADLIGYRNSLKGRLDPTAASLQRIFEQVRASPRRVVFAEGEEEKTIRAALAFRDNGYGTPVMIARHERISTTLRDMGLGDTTELDTHNPRLSPASKSYTDFLYARLQRHGALYRDCQRMVNQDRNVFAACMVACGDADAMVTGETRNYFTAFEEVVRVLGPKEGSRIFGFAILVSRGRSIFIADTTAIDTPTGEEIADIAMQSAARARHMMGQEPRVALLSHSSFGNPGRASAERVREAVRILEARSPDFEFDGEMSAEVALNVALMRDRYPFCRLTGAANVLIMPGLDCATLASQLLEQMGGGKRIGPLLMGLDKPAQIVEMGCTVSDFVNIAALAAHEAIA